ncbi:uncharacterized protein LOC135703348 [Ochlerotatus camptorhynchus]|uniref:uncharacterized protein LOC135703348 n=1 Tax=Ochlerotatus camptorhynchus TaxID=644619 RepID=UPI0031DBC681
MAQLQSDPVSTEPKICFKVLSKDLDDRRAPLVKEYNRIVLRPIIWNTLANFKICILNKSFGPLLEALETHFLKISATDSDLKNEETKRIRYALQQLRKEAATYLKSKADDKEKKLQDIENSFIECLKNISLPSEWEMYFDGKTSKQQAQTNAKKLVSDGIKLLKKWRVNPEINIVNQLVKDKTKFSFRSKIPTPKTPLQNLGTHPSLIIMLRNFDLFEPFLKIILQKYEVDDEYETSVNEPIQRDLDTPLHYAVRSLNKSFTQWLLEQKDIKTNRLNKEQRTPLDLIRKRYDSVKGQMLDKDITTQQLEEIKLKLEEYRTFLRMLVDKGANFEHSRKINPSFKYIPKVTERNDDLLLDQLNQMQKDDEEFLEECSKRAKAISDIELLESFLRLKDQVKFEEKLLSLNVEETECFVKKVIKFWLHTAVKLNLSKSVELIVKKFGSKIFRVRSQEPESNGVEKRTKTIELQHRVELKGLLRKVCDSTNTAVLKLLLKKMDKDKLLINDEPILVLTLHHCVKLDDKNERKADLVKCARMMVSDERISLAKTDADGNTALHIALKYGLEDIAMTICTERTTGFLGVRNKKGETPLDYAKHAFLKEYLDKTVKTFSGKEKEFKLDFNGLCPYYSKKMQHKTKLEHKNPKNDNRQTLSTIGCIKRISNSSKLKPLLNHPMDAAGGG